MHDPPIPVVVNRNGGTAASLGDRLETAIRDAFAAAWLAIDLVLVDGEEVAESVAARAGRGTVVVGGGDGSMAAAAAILAERNATLGVLPLGTRNHFAKDLGIPLDLGAAAKVIADGHRTRIDIARANDRAFVNNCVVGTYTRLVRMRERSVLPKLLATIPAAWSVFVRHDERRLRLAWPEGQQAIVTPMLFIGNNRYSLDEGRVGTRAALDRGRLSILAVARRGRLALIVLALRTLVGRADPMRDFAALFEAERMTLDGPGGTINLALDGNVARMTLPVAFSLSPRALGVFVPRGSPSAAR